MAIPAMVYCDAWPYNLNAGIGPHSLEAQPTPLVVQAQGSSYRIWRHEGIIGVMGRAHDGVAKKKPKFMATSDHEKGLCFDRELRCCHQQLKSSYHDVYEVSELLSPLRDLAGQRYTDLDSDTPSACGSCLIGSGRSLDGDLCMSRHRSPSMYYVCIISLALARTHS